MTDLVLSLHPTVASKFNQTDCLCPHKLRLGLRASEFRVLPSTYVGKPCLIHLRRHSSRIQAVTRARVARISRIPSVLDRELRVVLELASDAELCELCDILYGQSILSPLLKSVTYTDGPQDILVQLDDQEAREELIERLESRFLFLAADAGATLSGRRPSYHKVLLQVRKKLNVPCSTKLSTEDMEAEIFLHLLHEYSSKPKQPIKFSWTNGNSHVNRIESQQKGHGQWRGYGSAAIKLGAEELFSVILKGGSAVTISKLQHVLARRVSGKMLLEAAKYQIAKEMMKQGGQAAATKLETHVALLAARQGFACAASSYVALRSMMMLLGPLLWGTFLADIVIRATGTDYARVVRAIYAFAQIRLTRTYGWTTSKHQPGVHVVKI